ncbi:hypothetical protein [Sulfurimonas sp.]|uniref:fibronectin type III domain-containing protein n=1 Tax=Sulfurimonas sp. TaxID=2022749 RepID=UPI0025DAD463|nr:hypothetical protein [Sulfurimonas sp.]MDD5156690.1 hypothetical protein [Sulfurimonas sp.]
MRLSTLATSCAVLLLIFSGCSSKPVPKKEPLIDKTLPVIKLTSNGTIADINAVALEWEAISDERVKGIFIYKVALDENNSKQDEFYDSVESRFATHYLDTKIKADSRYDYYFKTFSDKAESLKSDVSLIKSLPNMNSVSWIHSIENMPRSAKIIWRPHPDGRVVSYTIQRKTLEEDAWNSVATVFGRLSAEYIDKNLKDKYTYKYRIRTTTYDGLVSNPSVEVSVITKELPKSVNKIAATTDLPKRVELKWEKSEASDFLHYNVYRSTNIDGSYSLIASTTENLYIDTLKEDGKDYFYRVSVVDKDKLESRSDENSVHGKTLVKPATPSLVEAKFFDSKVKLSWSNSDPRVKSFIVQKRYKKGTFEESIEDIENIKKSEFVDSDIQSDKTYYYRVFSQDANYIISESSIEVEIIVGKVLETYEQKKEQVEVKKEQKKQEEKKSAPVESVITPVKDFN